MRMPLKLGALALVFCVCFTAVELQAKSPSQKEQASSQAEVQGEVQREPHGDDVLGAKEPRGQQNASAKGSMAPEGDPQDVLPPPDDARWSTDVLFSRPLAPFTGGIMGTVAAGTLGSFCIGSSGLVFFVTGIVAIGGGGVPGLLLALASWGAFGASLVGFGPCSALLSAGGAAMGAELVDRRSLPLMLGALPGFLVGVVGAFLAIGPYFALGPIGFITQVFGTGLPAPLYYGVALQALAAPIALGGAFASAAFFGDSLDEEVGEVLPPENVAGELAGRASQLDPAIQRFTPHGVAPKRSTWSMAY